MSHFSAEFLYVAGQCPIWALQCECESLLKITLKYIQNIHLLS